MRLLLALILLLPAAANASFLVQYGLNYSSQSDDADGEEGHKESRTFHKVLLGASVNSNKTLFFGWNINQWSSSNKQGSGTENKYSILEMGPRVQWFLNDDYHWYLSAEWNPYAKGDRQKDQKKEISGSSMGFGLGYRFRLSKMIGFGAAIHYHTMNVKESKVDSNESNVNDKISNLMPMLELSILTR
jgi:outer membrane protein assembly factor BamA